VVVVVDDQRAGLRHVGTSNLTSHKLFRWVLSLVRFACDGTPRKRPLRSRSAGSARTACCVSSAP